MGAWTERPEKQLCFVLKLYIAMGCQWIMQEWKPKLSPRHAHAATRLSNFRLVREGEWINYLHGRATWEDVGGTGGG